MSQSLTDNLIVPVATEEDARVTATALTEYPYDQLTVVHVVEKSAGAPDKLSLKQAELLAEESFAAFRTIIPDIKTELTYASDVVAAINDLAVQREATAIAFRPRGGSRLIQLLSGDKALRLVTDTEVPVIALPDAAEEER